MAPAKIVIYLLNGFSKGSSIEYSSAAALYYTYDKETLNTWSGQKSEEVAFASVTKDNSLFTWEGKSFDLPFNVGKDTFRFRFMIPLPPDFTPVREATITKNKTTTKVRLRQTVSENGVAGAAAQIYRNDKGVDTVVGPLLTIYRADNGGIKHGKGLQHIFQKDNFEWLRVYYCTADEPRHFNLETIQHEPEGHEPQAQAGQESPAQAGLQRRRVVANASLLSEVMTSRLESSERSESIAEQPADNDENQDMLLVLGEELKVEEKEDEAPNEGVLSGY